MTPKEKAKKLVERMIIYHSPNDEDYETAKECALIAVDEILNVIWHTIDEVYYWEHVKKEIEKL